MPNENCNFPVITWYSVITWYFFLQNIVDNLVFSALTWKICSAGKFAKTLLYNTRGIMAKSDTTIMFSSHQRDKYKLHPHIYKFTKKSVNL